MTDSDKKNDPADIAFGWWRGLNPENRPRTGPQRAAMARLRRARDTLEVIREPEGLALVARFPVWRRERAAVLAGVLAFVREDGGGPIARVVGRISLDDAESASMSEPRFRRLLQTEDAELMDTMRRLVRFAKGRCNVRDLSRSVFDWDDRVKKQWIYDYYNVGGAAPSAERRGDSAP